MLFCMRIYFFLKKEIHVLYFWISILVIIGKKALLANADSKDLCLEQTFFEIVLEAFRKHTKDCSISVVELEKKSCSERFECIVFLLHLGAFILGFIFDVMLLLDTSYTRALALYYRLYLRILLGNMTLALLSQWILKLRRMRHLKLTNSLCFERNISSLMKLELISCKQDKPWTQNFKFAKSYRNLVLTFETVFVAKVAVHNSYSYNLHQLS